jgi:hypothetical protein
MFFLFWNKWTKSISRRMSSTNVFESLSLIQNASTQFQCNFLIKRMKVTQAWISLSLLPWNFQFENSKEFTFNERMNE